MELFARLESLDGSTSEIHCHGLTLTYVS